MGVLAGCLAVGSASAAPQDAKDEAALLVGVCDIEPFVSQQGDAWVGFGVELWDAVAEEMGRTWVPLPVGGVPEVVDAVAGKEVDVGLCGTSITADREVHVDFTQPFFRSGLQMVVRAEAPTPLRALGSVLAQGDVLRLLMWLMGLWVVLAHGFWLLQRNEEDHGYLEGVGEGLWSVVNSASGLGAGHQAPRGVGARVLSVVCLATGLLFMTYVTARVASTMTVSELDRGVRDPAQLVGRVVAIPLGTTSDAWATRAGVIPQRHPEVASALLSLRRGRADAVVYDAPVVQHYLAQHPDHGLRLAGRVFQEEDYGFAVHDAVLCEEIDQALLRIRERGVYDALHTKWFR